jgi:hypothetical protein
VDRGELGEGYEFFPDHVLTPAPAAGAPLIFPLEATWLWRIRAARVTLTTSAVVANRFLTFDYCDTEGTAWARNPAAAVQAAGVANQEYSFANRSFPISGIAGVPQFLDLLELWLPPSWQLRVNVANMDVVDQLSGLRLYVEKRLTRGL